MTRPWVARHGLTSAQYQVAFNEFTSQGYVLDWVSGYFDGSQDLYAAPNAPAWEARHGLVKATGSILVNGYTVGGQDRIAAIWTR